MTTSIVTRLSIKCCLVPNVFFICHILVCADLLHALLTGFIILFHLNYYERCDGGAIWELSLIRAVVCVTIRCLRSIRDGA